MIGKLARNSLWNVAGLAFTTVFSLIAIRLYVSRLDADAFGLLMLLRIITTPLGLLDFGSTPATVKYLAESAGRGDRAETGRYLRTSLCFSLMVGAVGTLLLSAGASILVTRVFSVPQPMQDLARVAVYWMAARFWILQATSTFNAVPIALQRYDLANAGNVVANTGIATAGLVGLYRGGTLTDLMAYEAVAAAVMVCGWILMARRLLPGVSMLPRWDGATFRRIFRFGFWQTIQSMGGVLAHEAERFVLGFLMSVAAVGFYTVAWNLASRVYSIASSLGQVLFPMVSNLVGQDRQRDGNRVILRAGWLLTMVSISLLVPLAVLAKEALLYWLGPDYAAHSFIVLRLVSLSAVVTSAFIVPSFFLLGIGQTKWLASVAIIQGTVTIAFSLVLIPRFGLEGAAWGAVAATATHVVALVAMWRAFFKEDVSLRVYLSTCFPNVAVGLALAILLSIAWDRVGGQPGLVVVALWAAVLSALALACMLLVSRLTPGATERQAVLAALLAWANQTVGRRAGLESRDVGAQS